MNMKGLKKIKEWVCLDLRKWKMWKWIENKDVWIKRNMNKKLREIL